MKLEVYQRLSDGRLFYRSGEGFSGFFYLKDLSNCFAKAIYIDPCDDNYEKITEHNFSLDKP